MIPRHLQIATALLVVAVMGSGLYILVLKQKAEEAAQRAADTRPILPPVAGPTQHVDLYIAYDDEAVVRRRDASIALPPEPSERGRQVLHALMGEYVKQPSPHPLAPGADVRDVYLVNDHMAVVDTTAAFADGHRSGVLVEALTVVSLVQTLAANVPGITRVKILVDGKERETLAGHADLMSFYDVATVNELVKQLQ